MDLLPPGLPTAGAPYWQFFTFAGTSYGFHPCLLAAICARETAFGTSRLLDKEGPGGRGDGGHGRGLMQIDDRSWAEWIAKTLPDGSPLWADPKENIKKSASILAAYVEQLGETRLAVSAYNCGPGNVQRQLRALSATVAYPTNTQRYAAADRPTAKLRAHDGTMMSYAEDVYQRYERFMVGL